MVKIIFQSSTISIETKKKLFDELYAKDETDTKVEYKTKIDAMISTGAERLAIYNSCVAEELTISSDVLGYTLEGLNDC